MQLTVDGCLFREVVMEAVLVAYTLHVSLGEGKVHGGADGAKKIRERWIENSLMIPPLFHLPHS